MTQGYYSLIQYCPDFSRAEAANVGLVLFQPEPSLTAVRVLDDVRPALRRLGRVTGDARLLRDVQAIQYRLEQERFGSVEQFEKFVRTRGNDLQLTLPRPMRIEVITPDVEEMFAELVQPVERENAAASEPDRLPLVLQELLGWSRRVPDRAWVDREFHPRGLGIGIRPDFAYQNGCLNLVRRMPEVKKPEALRLSALGLSREGELVEDLEEGRGKLIVLSTASARSALEREQEFGRILDQVGHAEFVPGDRAQEFADKVAAELDSDAS